MKVRVPMKAKARNHFLSLPLDLVIAAECSACVQIIGLSFLFEAKESAVDVRLRATFMKSWTSDVTRLCCARLSRSKAKLNLAMSNGSSAKLEHSP
jgi:hypothetical protein